MTIEIPLKREYREAVLVRPLVEHWLNENGYRWTPEFFVRMGRSLRADYVAYHPATNETLIVEAKYKPDSVNELINQLKRYDKYLNRPNTTLAAALPSSQVTRRMERKCAFNKIKIITLPDPERFVIPPTHLLGDVKIERTRSASKYCCSCRERLLITTWGELNPVTTFTCDNVFCPLHKHEYLATQYPPAHIDSYLLERKAS